MGADSIHFEINKKASHTEILKAFKNRQLDDRNENGSRSYSGDFQTVDRVDFKTEKIFTSYNEAWEYCLEHAKKWETVVAVYYTNIEVKTKLVKKLEKQCQDLQKQIKTLDFTDLDRKKEFQTCGNCKSKLAMIYFDTQYCPLCRHDLRPKSLVNRIDKLKSKLKALEVKRDDKIKVEREKLVSKVKNCNTLVAGWGAC